MPPDEAIIMHQGRDHGQPWSSQPQRASRLYL